MTKLLTATALAVTLLTTAAQAGELPDYTDRSEYTCDQSQITSEMDSMISNGPAGKLGVHLIYVKDSPVEVSRTKNELRCRIEIKTNQFSMKGIFRFHNEDGHALVGWQGGKNK
jgi:hypothetical protein